jgi:hypothetical protein
MLLAPDDARVLMATRSAAGERIVLAVNREPDARALAIAAADLDLGAGERLHPLLASAAIDLESVIRRDDTVIIRLPGLAGALFEIIGTP